MTWLSNTVLDPFCPHLFETWRLAAASGWIIDAAGVSSSEPIGQKIKQSVCVCVLNAVPPHVGHRKQMPHPWLWESERQRGREGGCVCIGAFQQGLCSLVAVVPHCSTVRHPEGYTDNKAVVKFGHFQRFMLTFANSSHMAICALAVLERGSHSLHFYPMKCSRKVNMVR